MSFELWALIVIIFFIIFTTLFIKALVRKEQPVGKSLKQWIVRIIDILSGGW